MSKFYCNTCNYGTDNKSNFNKIPTHLKLIAGESTTKTYKCDVEGCEYIQLKTVLISNVIKITIKEERNT